MSYKVAFERFSSINTLVRVNDARPKNKAFSRESELSSNTGSLSFTGTKSYGEAIDLISHGWDKPLDKLKKFDKAAVKTNTQADKRRPSTGIVGYAPCVPNAIIGLPNSMVTTETTRQKVKAVTLVYGASVNANWGTDEIIESGITMLNIIRELELSGIRVRLTVEAMSSKEDRDLSVLWIDIKDWREAIDLKKVAFPIAHPSMLRRVAFRWLETFEGVTNRNYTGGYGKPLGNEDYEHVVKVLTEGGLLKENEYYINAQLCKECRQDAKKVMERAGMSSLRTN